MSLVERPHGRLKGQTIHYLYQFSHQKTYEVYRLKLIYFTILGVIMSKKKVQEPAKEVKEPKRLYIEYNRSEYGGEAIDPSDRWSNRTVTVITVDFIRLHREQPKNRFFYDSIEVLNEDLIKLDKLYLAVVRYSTGDTFGRTEGEWDIVGVAPTYKIAEVMLEEAIKPAKPGDYKNYKPWEGYFERLEDTEIHTMEVV
jgi:hypothetical protein